MSHHSYKYVAMNSMESCNHGIKSYTLLEFIKYYTKVPYYYSTNKFTSSKKIMKSVKFFCTLKFSHFSDYLNAAVTFY